MIEAPTIGRDIAKLVMEMSSWYLDRLPLSRLSELKYDETGRLISKPEIMIK